MILCLSKRVLSSGVLLADVKWSRQERLEPRLGLGFPVGYLWGRSLPGCANTRGERAPVGDGTFQVFLNFNA